MTSLIDTEQDTFFPLLHAMLRATPSTEQDDARANLVMKWASYNTGPIANALDDDEVKLFSHVMDHWVEYNAAPDRQTLEDMVRTDSFPETQVTLLQNYDRYLPHLNPTDATAVMNVLKTRQDSWTRLKLRFVLQQASMILEPGLAADSYKELPRKGVKDTCNFLLQEIHSPTFNPESANSGGSMLDLADGVKAQYQKNEDARLSGKLTIKTGISLIDDVIGGYDRKTLNLILGTVGQRKSALARNIAYNAAIAGFRTLFLPLEFTVDEEIQIFAMMHAHSRADFVETESITINNFRNGTLAPEEKEFLPLHLVPSLKFRLGTNLVIRGARDRTWANIRGIIQAEDANKPLDLVVIDHLGLLDMSAQRDPVRAMNQAVKELKDMALYHDDGRGLVFVSPVHGNRKGYELAKLRDGYWEATDIYQYSDMEKSADTVMYCFMPEELKAENMMKIGFCKTRRHGTTVPQFVDVDPLVSLIGGSDQTKQRLAKETEDAGWSGAARRGPVSTLKDPTVYHEGSSQRGSNKPN
jgi:hypothetical protein